MRRKTFMQSLSARVQCFLKSMNLAIYAPTSPIKRPKKGHPKMALRIWPANPRPIHCLKDSLSLIIHDQKLTTCIWNTNKLPMERIISFFILAPLLLYVCSDHELSQTLIQPKQTGANFNFFHRRWKQNRPLSSGLFLGEKWRNSNWLFSI